MNLPVTDTVANKGRSLGIALDADKQFSQEIGERAAFLGIQGFKESQAVFLRQMTRPKPSLNLNRKSVSWVLTADKIDDFKTAPYSRPA